jgi:site-specific DNA recombinase
LRIEKQSDGYRMVIEPAEAAIVGRVFTDFAEGKAVTAIVKVLNGEGVKGRRRIRNGWSPATVSRLLRNEKYIGRWIWNRTETRRDPRTGRLRQFPKPASEWHVVEDGGLRIVPQDVWDRVTMRWSEIARTWPRRPGKRGFEGRQRSYVETHSPQLLSGSLRCGVCGGAIGQVSGKGAGYYGCLGAAKHACANRLLVSRRLAERRVLESLRQKCSTPAAIREVLERIEAEVQRLHADVPQTIKLKAALAEEERRIVNFIEFIGDGKGTSAFAEALRGAEAKAAAMREELRALDSAGSDPFKTPPVEWVAARLEKVQEVLERETTGSALLLRRILGPIRLVPVTPEVGRPYYQAETALQVLELIQDPEGGSNSLSWWRRWESNPRPETLSRRRLRR